MTADGHRLFYHGTTEERIAKYNPVLGEYLEGFSIDLSLCRPRTDFGQGFYLTTSRKQAKNWASNVTHRSRGIDRAALLEFSIDLDAIGKLDDLWFVRDTEEFHSFVDRCRQNNLAHGRNRLRMLTSTVSIVWMPLRYFNLHD